MAYTVKELAKISGVSVRTLHWYDEIGLLKPSYLGANGYRYYEIEQLLRLQQILLYRELEFSLNDIARLLAENEFDNIKSLYAHRKQLEDGIARKNSLIDTINKTIQHLRGKQIMNDKELFYGFDSAQKYIEHLIDTNGSVMKKQIDQYREHFKKFNKDDWSSMASESDAIYKALAKAIEEEAIVDSEEVQNIMNRYFQYSKRLMKELVSKDNLKNVAEKYDNPSMKKVLGTYHPRMFEFFLRALQFYANKNLQ